MIPATFLIGPDGRILAKNLRGPALKEAIVKALKDGKFLATRKKEAQPERFPLTRFEVPVEKSVETPLAVVLDDCDEDFEAARPHHDALRILYKTEDGVRTSLLREFNTCQTVGAVHGVAIDAARGRIYLCEQVSHRVTAVDFHGRKLWQVAKINADALAVDPRTGNLWCSVGEDLAHGETVVLNADGQEVANFPFRGIDIAYDPHTDGFWLVGYGITKLSREGKVLFRKPQEGWAYASVAPNPRDGSVWVVERAHPDVAGSMNRLWHLAADGSTIRKWDLGEKHIFGVACEPVTGTAWAVFLGSEILRFTADGKELPPLPVKARAISISPTTGQILGDHRDGNPASRRGRPAEDLFSFRCQVRTVLAGCFVVDSPSTSHRIGSPRQEEPKMRFDSTWLEFTAGVRDHSIFRSPLSRRHVMTTLLVGSTLLLLIGGFGFTRAEQAARDQPAKADAISKGKDATKTIDDKKAAGKLALRAVSAETREPIEGVAIEYTARIDDGKFLEATVFTGEDGTTAIEWAPGVTVHKLWLTARKPNLVPIHILWDDERHPINLPTSKELRFEPGTTIGGIVQDEAGHPIEGATVHVHAPPTESEKTNSVFTLGSSRTDAQGRWRLDVAPKDLSDVWANVEHPHHQGNGTPASSNLDSVTILKKGLTVTGRVVDAAGRPVRGARAIFGPEHLGTPGPPRGTTNDRGEFTLETCDPGPSIITVQADGFAPRIEEVRVAERTAPVEIRMTEPGSILRVRVIDIQGKPVAGAVVAANTWRGHRSIEFRAETDRDGRLAWRGAPKDVVRYNIGKEEYMWIQPELTASGREQTVTLHPKLVVGGRVTDAETGRPLLNFRVVRGTKLGWRDGIDWSEDMAVEVTNGRYTAPFDQTGEGAFIRIEAKGYKPAVSRAFQPTEGSQTLDFALQRAAGLTGVVLRPDGKPAAGAEVVLASSENQLTMKAGRFDRVVNAPKTATGPDGGFEFPARDGQFLVLAVSDFGYAEASSDEFAKSGKLVLQPWGTIEGGVRIGARLGAGQEVVFHPIRPEGRRGIVFNYGYETRSDERGRFRFDRVIPGPGNVTRSLVTEYPGGMTSHMPCWPEAVEVKPGVTLRVTVGGKGRPVIGRLVLDGTPESPVELDEERPGGDQFSRGLVRRAHREGRPVSDRGCPAGPAKIEGCRQCVPRCAVQGPG